METRFDITVRHRGPVVVVHPRGRLTVHSATALREILANKLRNHGQVVVDLDGFALDHAAAVEIFPAVMTECGGWPVAKLVLCRPDPQMAQVLTTRQVSSLVPVHPLLLQAEAAIDRRPDIVRLQTPLPGGPRASVRARQLVRDICPLWQIDDDLQDTAQVVASELAGITAHAATAAGLTLEQGPCGLVVAIRDASLSLVPRPRECSTDLLRRGQGVSLEMLANLTAAWGVEVHPDGKTAWAKIST
jgi:anti-anti-sigma regulatory factor